MNINLDYLLTLDGETFSNSIKSTTKESRGLILADSRIRTKLMEDVNHYPFVWLIQSLSDEEILFLCDNEFIPLLKNNTRFTDKLNAIMTCGNPFISAFLSEPEVINSIIHHFDKLNVYLSELDFSFGKAFFNVILEKFPNCIGYLCCLSTDVQVELLSDELVVETILSMEHSREFVRRVPNKVLTMLFSSPKVQANFLDYYIEDVSGRLDRDDALIIPDSLLNNQKFIDKYLSVSDISHYRIHIERLKKNHMDAALMIDQKRKMEYRRLFDSGEIFQLPEVTQLEVTIDMYFDDVTFDFIRILKTMLSFNDSLKSSLIPEDRLSIYQSINRYEDLSIDERKSLFDALAQYNDPVSMFYDDFRLCQNTSYEMLNDKVLNDNNILSLLNQELSDIYGIPVYELRGEEFYSLMTVTYESRNNGYATKRSKYPSTTSMSLINHNHIGTYSSMDSNITLGFFRINPDRVMHMYHSDSATSKTSSSNLLTKIYTPETLISETQGYNEILYLNNENLGEKHIFSDTGITGNYIIANNKILSGDIAYAKAHNIPIVLLHSHCYGKKDGFGGYDYFDKGYTLSSSLPENYHKGR